tara:strand:- start:92 stop:889 length:798 start_codon:yes stop_codon:yes gene_type:complete
MFKYLKNKYKYEYKMSKKQVVDYLDVDDAIAGQNYVCMSFVDPDEIIKNKEAFKTAKFLQSYSKDKGIKFEELYEEYLNYQYKFQDELQRDFDKENKNINNVRGIKIRGVYSSKEEAEMRSKKLQRNDSTFHVFVGQVGYWLPFNPCADKIEKEEFSDTALNELMQKYKENNINKDILYQEEKREKMKQAQEEVQSSKRKRIEELSDPEPEPEPEPEAEAEPEAEPEVEPEPEPEPESDSKLDESLKESLNKVDPWLQSKIDNNE